MNTRNDSDFASKATAFGEVLSSSITNVVAQVWQNDTKAQATYKPRFGSFITIESSESSLLIFGVIFDVITCSPDSVHKPFALGMTREQLRAEQPHIFSLLQTEVHATIVGFQQGDSIFQNLPPHPPDVHDFIYPATLGQVRSLTESFDFLRLLMHLKSVPADELLTATIREAQKTTGRDDQFLIAAGRALSSLLQNDYDRLIGLLKKIRPAPRY